MIKVGRCIFLSLLLLLPARFITFAQHNNSRYALIPYPVRLQAGSGSFTISPATRIIQPPNAVFKKEARLLSELFIHIFGRPLQQGNKWRSGSISLIYDASVKAKEGYRLSITAKEVKLYAVSPAGLFMGIQTIRQLLPVSIERAGAVLQKSISLPAVEIEDGPAFAWRGMHLDVSRHFFSLAYLKKTVNLMALYKLNKLHLHLTDDQGWRIEIKKYPQLTAQGAWRTFNKQDSACLQLAEDNPDFKLDEAHLVHKNGKTLYGGFYTQQQLKDLVAYAAARHIEIVPEIDMPGHMMAAINAYSYLSCDGKSGFGETFSRPICPCMPSTFDFAKDVFTEVMYIFPSEYIHLGGDEVDRSYWAASDECKALMKKEGLKTTAELQSYFIRIMERFFNERGRKLIGWDEILEGGISKSATIMYWRNWVPNAPVVAARQGNSVIMATGNPLYFSTPPDKNSLFSVYNFNPVPAALTKEEVKNIWGAQSCLWSEQVPTERRADYLLMPRITALAERLWTNKNDYTAYLQNLKSHYERLDLLQVNYRLPDLPLLEKYAFTQTDTLHIAKPLENLVIRYTLDGSKPGAASAILTEPLIIRQSSFIRLAACKPDGTMSEVYDVHYTKEAAAEAEPVAHTSDGLLCNWYKKSFTTTRSIHENNRDGFAYVTGIIVPKEAEAPVFALQYKGYLDVPTDGTYTFYLTSDDGSTLSVAGREVVNNDGFHPPKERNGQVVLKKGLHSMELCFIEGGGGYTLSLQYSLNGSDPQDIPATWFKKKDE